MGSVGRLALCLSAIAGVATAHRFDILVRATPSSNSTESTAVATTAATPSPSGPVSLAPSFSGNNSVTANATTHSNSTHTSAIPVSFTDPADIQAAKNASLCHREEAETNSDNDLSPFCEPNKTVEVVAGDTTYFIWDQELYSQDAMNTIKLTYQDYLSNPSGIVNSSTVNNTQGWAKISMLDDWLHSNSSANLTFFMLVSTGDSTEEVSSNRRITLVDKSGNDKSSSKKPSKLGMGLGIPLAFAFVAFVIVGLFLCMRRRRKSGGYIGNRSRSQRNSRTRAIQPEDDDWNGGTRGPDRFRDDPDPGVELQDRVRGHRRGDSISIGSLGSSPTHDGFETQGQTGGNAFRDEISRQRDKNR